MSDPTPTLTLTVPPVDINEYQQALVKLITDTVSKAPETKEEALKLFQTLQKQLSEWLASHLPETEAKAMLAASWAVEQVTSSGCFGFLQSRQK
jgi:hypothetical protein